ncbi:MAG: CDP-alcohol phosphatidyltransferase family protein [Proteobacteria bacterium]|nr:CDP-alcohol phosphatidyltransferase family protein [Pseudomonadota bacterium]
MANAITLARLPLLFLIVGLLYSGSPVVYFICFWLIIVLVLMDWFDGYVARMRDEVSDLGSILDIALDRVVENVFWLVFFDLNLVPVWVPLVFLSRSFIIDSMRSFVLQRGMSAFGMMHTRAGRFLVASRFMRATYGVAKVSAWCGLALGMALSKWLPPDSIWFILVDTATRGLVYVSVGMCLARGLPVLWDVRAYLGVSLSDEK